MAVLAVIPARGGSKRLPGKNVADFCGRPIITWTIEAALEAGLFDRLIVSTDDPAIAARADGPNVHMHMRPAVLATDTASVVDVCLHLLESEERNGRRYDILCCLYATAPLRHAGDIRATVGLVQSGQCSFAMAVTRYHFPPWQALTHDASGRLAPMWPAVAKLPSQKVAPMLVDNGSTYAVRVAAFRKERTFLGSDLRGHLMPRRRSVDIDEAEDLEIARLFSGQRRS